MKKVRIILILSFFLACSGRMNPLFHRSLKSSCNLTEGNEEGSGGEENETPILNLVIDGLDLNYENLEAVSISGVSNLNGDGSFGELESEPEIPVIITDENDDLLFGYYPSLLTSEEITNKDLILFFINTYPDFAIKNFDLVNIHSELNNVNFDNLYSEIIKSLNAGENPYFNEGFRAHLRGIVEEITERLSAIETNRNPETANEFEIKYTRDNQISFPQKSPLYVSIGVGFEHEIKNEVYSELLTPKLTSDYRESIGDKIEEFFFGEEDQTEQPFQGSLVHDGEWGVRITNGRHGDSKLAVDTRHQNTKQLNAVILSYTLPIVFKAVDLDGPCGDRITEIAEDLLNKLRSKLEDPNATFDAKLYEEIIKETSETLSKIYESCLAPQPKKQTYVKVFRKWLGKIFSVITFFEDLGQLILIDRDFTSSIIDKYNLLYLDKEQNLLFSTLGYQNISETNFEGETGDIFNYEAIVKEYWQKYEIKTTTVRSEFITKSIEKPGNQLPFKVEKLSGDALYTEGSVTNDQGELKLNFELNEQDSEFNINPSFRHSESNANLDLRIKEFNLEDKLVGNCTSTPLSRGILCDNGNDLQNLLWNRSLCFKDDGTVSIPECMGPNPIVCTDSGTWVLNGKILIIEFSRELIHNESGHNSNSIIFKYEGQYNSEFQKFEGSYYYHLKNHDEGHGYTCEETKQAEIQL